MEMFDGCVELVELILSLRLRGEYDGDFESENEVEMESSGMK